MERACRTLLTASATATSNWTAKYNCLRHARTEDHLAVCCFSRDYYS